VFVLGEPSSAHAASALTTSDAAVCAVSQITDSTGSGFDKPTLSGGGTRVAVRPITVPSTASRGLYLFDLNTGTVTKLDDEAGAPGTVFVGVDDAGTHIVTASPANPTGANADGNLEIFVFDTTAGTVDQITHTTPADEPFPNTNLFPSLSGDGARVAFQSRADLTGENPNHDGVTYLFDRRTRIFTLIARTTSNSNDIQAVNGDGTRIVLASSGDLTGLNPDGNSEIFVFEAESGSLRQITRTLNAVNGSPTVNSDGSLVGFRSNANLTGANSGGNSEIFLFETATGRFTQVTHTVGGFNDDPSLNGDGTRIAFLSTGNFTGDNPDGNPELFVFDTISGNFVQVTVTAALGLDFSNDRAMSLSGTRIVFTSTDDLVGSNPDRNREVFVAACGLVNDLVSLTALPDTYRTSADTTGCPAGFTRTFSFAGRLASLAGSPDLTDVRVQVNTLTEGHLLQNADAGPGGLAATLTVPHIGPYADGVLSAGEAVAVPFVICLQDRSSFQFFVDVLGTKHGLSTILFNNGPRWTPKTGN
jgi:Tol biopolymer transport system component